MAHGDVQAGLGWPARPSRLTDAREDLLAFAPFPLEHWRKVWSTNPLERVHREVKRRCDVFGVLPNDAAIDRLVTAVIVEQHDGRGRAALPVGDLDGPAPPGRPRSAPRPGPPPTATDGVKRVF